MSMQRVATIGVYGFDADTFFAALVAKDVDLFCDLAPAEASGAQAAAIARDPGLVSGRSRGPAVAVHAAGGRAFRCFERRAVPGAAGSCEARRYGRRDAADAKGRLAGCSFKSGLFSGVGSDAGYLADHMSLL
jgi:hypothetical protein